MWLIFIKIKYAQYILLHSACKHVDELSVWNKITEKQTNRKKKIMKNEERSKFKVEMAITSQSRGLGGTTCDVT